MNRRFFLTFGLIAALVAFFALTLPAQASLDPQLIQYATPTPQPDGRIIYIVKEGDNCISIAALNGIGLEQLYQQNPQLNTDCSNLVPGMQLLLGIGGPASYTPTPGPSPTPTIAPPTPTPFSGTTAVCILLYDDLDGNATRAETEFGIEGGQVSVTDVNGAYTDTKSTVNQLDADAEPIRTCFDDVPEGTYNVSIAVPEGFNPTSEITYRLDVKAGETVMMAFGAQSKTIQAEPETPEPQETGKFPVMGVLGGVLLLAGIGMGWYALQMRKPSSKFKGR